MLELLPSTLETVESGVLRQELLMRIWIFSIKLLEWHLLALLSTFKLKNIQISFKTCIKYQFVVMNSSVNYDNHYRTKKYFYRNQLTTRNTAEEGTVSEHQTSKPEFVDIVSRSIECRTWLYKMRISRIA